MKLAELEHYFAAVATSTSGPPADLDEVFKSSTRMSASARLAVYNRGYHYRLLDALSAVFTRTQRALGNSEFERIGLSYLARYPSEHPAIERVGRKFPEYLAEIGMFSGEIVDLARLEWARLRALVAPDAGALANPSAVDLATFAHSRLCFVPALSTLLLSVRALSGFAAESQAPGAERLEPGHASSREAAEPEFCRVAVWRQQHTVLHRALDALEFEALRLALAGEAVSLLCALFDTGAESDDALRAFQMISAWFARGWIERAEVLASCPKSKGSARREP